MSWSLAAVSGSGTLWRARGSPIDVRRLFTGQAVTQGQTLGQPHGGAPLVNGGSDKFLPPRGGIRTALFALVRHSETGTE